MPPSYGKTGVAVKRKHYRQVGATGTGAPIDRSSSMGWTRERRPSTKSERAYLLTGDANIDVLLPFDVTSFSLDYGILGDANVTFELLDSTGDIVESLTKSSTSDEEFDAYALFSIDSTTPFDSVLITVPDNILRINNLAYTPAAVTPEPGTLSLLGTGLLLLLGDLVRRNSMCHNLTRRKLVAA